jgi:O-antigen/teichoic acid export membrane protein
VRSKLFQLLKRREVDRQTQSGEQPELPKSEQEQVSGRRLAWNSLLNLFTGAVLILLSIAFIPMLIRSFGVELFGVLAITWTVLFQLTWLDFGFSRASAKFIAEELSSGSSDQAALWAWTALFTQVGVGLVASIALWISAPALAGLLHVHHGHTELVIFALRLFGLAIPLDLASRSLAGVCQAGQRFAWINSVSLFGALWTYAVYGLGILDGGNFKLVVFGLFLLRFFNALALYVGAARVVPAINSLASIRRVPDRYRSTAVQMLRFGGWVTLSALFGPMLLYFDQWVIGILLGAAILPYYTVPLNILLRLGILPSSLTTTLFPAFSSLSAAFQWRRVEALFFRAHRYIAIVGIPILFSLFVWAHEVLRIWIGRSFADHAVLPLRILIVGTAISLLAPLSGALLEGIGRPDTVAKVYLIEFPLNIALVVALTLAFGIVGAALSFTLRTSVETFVFWIIVPKVMPVSWQSPAARSFIRVAPVAAVMSFLPLLFGRVEISSIGDLTGTLLILAGYCAAALFLLLDGQERAYLSSFRDRLLAKQKITS